MVVCLLWFFKLLITKLDYNPQKGCLRLIWPWEPFTKYHLEGRPLMRAALGPLLCLAVGSPFTTTLSWDTVWTIRTANTWLILTNQERVISYDSHLNQPGGRHRMWVWKISLTLTKTKHRQVI